MEFTNTVVRDCFLIKPKRFEDNRGFFQEAYRADNYNCLIDSSWKQMNWSNSKKGVIRGIHYAEYSKLVTCVKGRVWDVVVDLRKNSSSYKKIFSSEINEFNGHQMYVPPGCGHGFLSLVEDSAVVYLQSGTFGKDRELTYKYDSLGVDWPFFIDYILSDRDSNSQPFFG
jgi:dTDP-4-dehydrorhamnose 3,5-epimerase